MLRRRSLRPSSTMTFKALCLIADGSEEIEFTTAYDVFVRAGYTPTICGVQLKDPSFATCSRFMKIHVDTTDLPSDPGDYAVVTVPGGAKGAATLSESAPVQTLLQKFDKAGKLVGTICAGSLAVKTAGLVVGGKVTSHPSVEKEFGDYKYSEDRVVVDGHVVSSRGPGTTLEWSLKMVELLSGKGKRDEVAGAMVLHPAIA